jgi:arylsulfatase
VNGGTVAPPRLSNAERARPRGPRGAALALVLCSCGYGDAQRGPQRWIAAPPEAFLAYADLHEVTCSVRFDTSAGRLPDGLRMSDGSLLAGVGAGAAVVGGEVAPRLEIGGRFQRSEVSHVLVVASGVRRGQMKLRWRSEQSEGEAVLHRNAATGARRDRFLFDLSESLPKTARAVAFELVPTSVAGEVVNLREVCFGRAQPSPARRAEAATAAFKVDLDHEVRDVLVVPEAGRLTRTIEVADAARLEFGLGLLGPRADVALRVEAQAADREERVTLLDERVAAPAGGSAWIDRTVELARFAGERVELAIAVEPLGGADRARAVPVLAHPTVVAPGRRRPPSIVLVSLDTLRADHLELYGYERATAPALAAWAKRRATVFERVVAPSGWTLPSHFSLFTGLAAYRHPANYNSIALDESAYELLAESLWRAGYRTVAVTGGGFVHPVYGFATGFERYRYWAGETGRESELEANLERALRTLESAGDRPLFFFFHTYEIHAPNPLRGPFAGAAEAGAGGLSVNSANNPPRAEEGFLGTHHLVLDGPDGTRRKLQASERQLAIDAYDAAIRFTDERLARLLERMERNDRLSDAVVAIVSDHGEFLGEEGRGGHAGIAAENLFVPLLLATGRARTPERVSTQVGLIDLHATLVELAGLAPDPALDARSLAPLLEAGSGPDRTVTAYAASTNFGLARYFPDRRKLEWRNSPWRPLYGETVWFEAADLAERRLAGAPGDPRGERRVRELVRDYERAVPGLRIDVRSRAARPLALRLWSDLVDPVALKVRELSGTPLDWRDIRFLEIPLAAGARARLVAERVVEGRLGMRAELIDSACSATAVRTLSIAISEIDRLGRIELPAPECPPGSGAGAVELELRLVGPPAKGELVPPEALADDLRALGYLR